MTKHLPRAVPAAHLGLFACERACAIVLTVIGEVSIDLRRDEDLVVVDLAARHLED